MAKSKVKFYAVRRGRQPGVYETWDEAQQQVTAFPGAVHRSFPTRQEAQEWLGPYASSSFRAATGSSSSLASLLDAEPRARMRKEFGLNPALFAKRKATKTSQSSDHLPPPKRPVNRTTSSSSVTNNTTLDPHISSTSDPILSPQQSQILERILKDENFFFTGSAGTGKSVLLRAIIRAFRQRYGKEKAELEKRQEEGVRRYLRGEEWEDAGGLMGGGQGLWEDGSARWTLGVTASTGMAAVNIGGCTLHSWAGIGLGEATVQKLTESIKRNKPTLERWQTTHTLVIDEISMIDGALFDKLEQLGRRLRRDPNRPFGGLQVICCGDFFQLPPVAKRDGPPYKFAFEAKCWTTVFPKDNMLALTRVFRQKEDAFVRILEGMRKGRILPQDVEILQKCDRGVLYDDGIEPVGLYPSKMEVATINDRRLQALDTPIQTFRAYDVPGIDSKGYQLKKEEATGKLNLNTLWPAELNLKVGAMVMLITNMQDGALVNGSTGVVVDFLPIPQALEAGIYMPTRAHNFAPARDVAWPIVEFVPAKHAAVQAPSKVLIPQMAVDIMNAQGDPEATRHQIPLILSWAITIHKSQGQTIDRLRVDLQKIFVEGQTYVAISRATSLENLEIRNFSSHKIMAHSRVIEWARPFEDEQREDEEWDALLADHDIGL